MSTYFHHVDALAFQHQVAATSKELHFRLDELIQASKASIDAFKESIRTQKPTEKSPGNVFQYRLTSLIALVQTYKDLIKEAGLGFSWGSLIADVAHADLMQRMRNSLVHDGYRLIALWAEGKFYVAVNIRRKGMRGEAVEIEAPEQDAEMLCLEYVRSFSAELSARLRELPESAKLKGPYYDYDWFAAAMLHPAIGEFRQPMPSREEYAKLKTDESSPLDIAVGVLTAVRDVCEARMKERLQPPSA
ncbi:hypothetical protein SAMN05216345_10336 [Cupriavidus sp. YR651]|uniref:hypothetical protein n=1 Tax=Cupriavidus sp. YR651 TaxID=1855315 RepID=UPI0008901F9D|nr:hypothetical protein [Cupriavidus sp. YR651]SDC62187.1 hypothetical protein SAMN05216345_10336 [Cupriavidus sp. YR651]